MKSFTAGANENDVRLSRFVECVTKDMPRSMMYKAFRNKRIKVNGKRAEPDTRLKTGDLIEMYIMLRGISLVTHSTKRLRRTSFSLAPAVKLFMEPSLISLQNLSFSI